MQGHSSPQVSGVVLGGETRGFRAQRCCRPLEEAQDPGDGEWGRGGQEVEEGTEPGIGEAEPLS